MRHFRKLNNSNISKAVMHTINSFWPNQPATAYASAPNRRRRAGHDAGEQAVVGGVAGYLPVLESQLVAKSAYSLTNALFNL